MNICAPILSINEEANETLISRIVDELKGKEDPFVILSKTNMTYIQALWVNEGYHIEYQTDNIEKHYQIVEPVSPKEAESILQKYLIGNMSWQKQYQFEHKKILDQAGYKLGKLFGKMISMFKKA